MTDGPFAETHEHIAGYFFVDAESLSQAVGIASRITPARDWGYVEVRQVLEIDGLPEV